MVRQLTSCLSRFSETTTYDANGNAHTTTYSHYVLGKPQVIKSEFNGIETFTYSHYDAAGNLIWTIGPDGTGTAYTYTSGNGVPNGSVATTSRVTGTPTAADVDSPTYSPTVVPGTTTTNTYYPTATPGSPQASDPAYRGSVGRLYTSTNSTGVTTSYAYTAAGLVSDVYRQWPGHSVHDSHTAYDDLGRVTAVTDAKGKTTSTHYNALGQVDYTTDAYQHKTWNSYDSRGELIRTLYSDGTETRSVYDALGRVSWASERYVSTTTVSSGGVFTNDNTSRANATRTLYDSLGRVTGTERYKGVLIEIDPDSAGVGIYQTSEPSATALSVSKLSSTQTIYNAAGQVGESVSATGLHSYSTYYPDGQLMESYSDPAHKTRYKYDKTADLPAEATGAGAVSYDKVTDGEGNATKTYKDKLGRAVETVYADGSFSQTTYGRFGQVLSGDTAVSVPAAGTETIQIGRHQSSESAKTTIDVYDAQGELTDVWLPAVVDGSSGSTTPVRPHWRYFYDEVSNQTKQLDAKNQPTLFGYDEQGHQTSRKLPGLQTELFSYDGFGREASHTDFKGQVETFGYDDFGRLTDEKFSANATTSSVGQSSHYTYDSLGRRASVTDDSGQTMYAYDDQGNLITAITPEGRINYRYNDLGQHTRTFTDSTDLSYGYDPQGRLTSVTVTKLNGTAVTGNNVTSYTYDSVGRKTTETLPNGVSSTWTYEQGLMTRLTDTKGTTTLFDQTYTYNGDGTKHSSHEVQTQTSGGTLTLDTTWTYDADGRLSGEHVDTLRDGVADPSLSYTDRFGFDLNNNRTSKTRDQSGTISDDSITYSFNADDQLLGETSTLKGTTTYGYDDNGSQISVTHGSDVTIYTYDLRNKLVAIAVNGTTTATYQYDDNGNRVAETTGGTTSHYLTDDNNPTGYAQPIERKTNNSTTPSTTYLAGDRVFSQTDNADTSSVIYLLLDGHGSTQQVTSTTGSIVQAIQYDAFGSGINQSPLSPTHTVYLFGGDAMYDPASGLYLHGDGTRGRSDFRFIQDDDHQYGSNANPISLNLSLYAAINPNTYLDPSGHGLAELGMVLGGAALLIGLAAISPLGRNTSWVAGTGRGANIPIALSQLSGQYASIEIKTQLSVDAVFQNLTQFKKLNLYPVKAGGNIVGIGETVTFDVQPWVGWAGQGQFGVFVTKFDRSAHSFVVRTAGGHPLAGWRYWGVKGLSNGDIQIETYSIETPATAWDSVKMNVLSGNSQMSHTWDNMLNSLATMSQGTVINSPLTVPGGVNISDVEPYLHNVLAPGEIP